MKNYIKSINDHYGQTELGASILAALELAGKDVNALTRNDLTSFDEFHIQGRAATRDLAQYAELKEGTKVLDLGCGIGGSGRTLAAEFGCQVTGVDLVDGYWQTAQMLSDLVGLSRMTTF